MCLYNQFICTVGLSLLLLSLARAGEANYSKLVHPGSNGELVYEPYTDKGDTIPDFSYCGYMMGGVKIPEVPVKLTLSPDEDSEDDLPRIQAAIDEISKLPRGMDGFRGALLLRRGRYRLNGTLKIAASGIVLRGDGPGEDGTVLIAPQRKQHTLIQVDGEGRPREIRGTRQEITDDYVPVGARSFHVEDVSGFEVGDEVIVHRPSTAEWIHEIGMDRIPMSHPNVKQWKPGSKDMVFQRTIAAIEANRITVDAPVVNSFQKEYGGGSVYKYEFPGRIEQVGIESLRGESEFEGKDDEAHAWDMIVIDQARDCWVRDVTSRYFGYGCVGISRWARSITVQDSQCLDPISKITGSRRYSFWITGQLNLIQRCYTRHGRHDFVMHSVVSGPNVFLDCNADNAHSDSGPHHRWATGTLYDNVIVNGNALNAQNAGAAGTGHGWRGAQMVFWNCTADRITCQKPPTAQNFAIGCKGTKRTREPDGWWESRGKRVEPRSLYLKQLEDRLGSEAVKNIAR